MASIISSIFLSNPRENANVHVTIAHTLATDQPFDSTEHGSVEGGANCSCVSYSACPSISWCHCIGILFPGGSNDDDYTKYSIIHKDIRMTEEHGLQWPDNMLVQTNNDEGAKLTGWAASQSTNWRNNRISHWIGLFLLNIIVMHLCPYLNAHCTVSIAKWTHLCESSTSTCLTWLKATMGLCRLRWHFVKTILDYCLEIWANLKALPRYCCIVTRDPVLLQVATIILHHFVMKWMNRIVTSSSAFSSS
jgi:hypothetical protein